MEQKQTELNIKLYAWFRIMREPLFWAPILITYIVNIGKMDLSEVYFMESVVVFGIIFVEIYSSAWADLLGRKKAMIIGSLLNLIAIILFSLVYSPWLVWVSNILVMVAFAIISGADEAFLVDTLKEAGRYSEFTKINGRIMARRFAIVAFSCIASGYLYSIDPRLPMILGIPGVFLSLVVTFFFIEPKVTKKPNKKEHFELMKMSILFVANHKKIRWIMGYMAIILVASKLWFFTYNPYFELVNLDPKYFGWIFFAVNITAWLSSKFAHKIEGKYSELGIVVTMLLLIAVPMVLMGTFVAQIAIAFILFENLSRGFREPFFSNFMNRHIESKNRATVLSIKSAAMALVSAIGLWVFGLALTQWQLNVGLQALGVIVLAFGVISVLRYKSIFRK